MKTAQSKKVTRIPLSRERVVAMARRMIVEDGHEALSLRSLARRLGVTAAALYAYVDDKQDVLRAVADAGYQKRAEKYQEIKTKDPLKKLLLISRTYVAEAQESPELFQLTILFPPIGVRNAGKDDTDVGQPTFDIAAEAVKQAMDQGQLRKGDVYKTSIAIWSAVHGIASFVIQGADFVEGMETELVDTVVKNLLSGLGGPKSVSK